MNTKDKDSTSGIIRTLVERMHPKSITSGDIQHELPKVTKRQISSRLAQMIHKGVMERVEGTYPLRMQLTYTPEDNVLGKLTPISLSALKSETSVWIKYPRVNPWELAPHKPEIASATHSGWSTK